MEESLKDLILQRVDAVDSLLLKEDEFARRQSSLTQVEKILTDLGQEDIFQDMMVALQDFEYKLCSNVYLQGLKDNQTLNKIKII
jgi:hypothetical protein